MKSLLIILISWNIFTTSSATEIQPIDLYGFRTSSNIPISLTVNDSALLHKIAQDTWNYIQDAVDKESNLPVDQVQLSPDIKIAGYTSPTNVGLYYSSIISAYDLKIINRREAVNRISICMDAVDKLETYRGFLYNWYDFRDTPHRSTDFISFVDCGWYAMGLIMVRRAFPKELDERTSIILKKMDFSFFYDLKTGQMWHGYYTDSKKYSDYHYGAFCTEARAPSLMVIGKQEVPRSHWFQIYRTLPLEISWQKQKPQGNWKSYEDIPYFEGYYQYEQTKIVPSWGGSLFEYLMPLLFINEQVYAKHSLGENNRRAVDIHIRKAKSLGYPVWGMSPCAVPNGTYGEYGVPELGMKETGYPVGVVTPHVSFLALMVNSKESIRNIRNILSDYSTYHPVYGFYDSVNPTNGEIAHKFLSLDQSMIMISLDNYSNQGIMQKRYAKDIIGKKSLPILSIEKFYN